MKQVKTKLHNTVKGGAKKVKASKVLKSNNKSTKSEQSKKLKRTFAKVKNKTLYQMSMKLSKEYSDYINTLSNKDLYNILKLHKFDMEYWKSYIIEYKISNKEKLSGMVSSLCKYLYFENKEFLKYLKSKEYKEKQEQEVAKAKEDKNIAKAKKDFNKKIAKEVKQVIKKETNKK